MTTSLLDRPPLPQVLNDLSRREFITGGLALGLLVAGGCSSGSGGLQESGSGPFPVTITHRFGSTTIERKPERVVAVGRTEADAVLAMGIAPVGIREFIGSEVDASWPWVRDLYRDRAPEVLAGEKLNLERVAALEPDLIVGAVGGRYAEMAEAEYRTLSEVAPTIGEREVTGGPGEGWKEQTLVIGDALGERPRAERLIADLEAKLTEARGRFPELIGKTGVLASYIGRELYIYGRNDHSWGAVAVPLDIRLPARIDELVGQEQVAPFSDERMEVLGDADLVIWQVNAPDEQAAITGHPLYSELEVARQNRHLFLVGHDPVRAAMGIGSVLSLPYVVDELFPKMVGALGGSPDR